MCSISPENEKNSWISLSLARSETCNTWTVLVWKYFTRKTKKKITKLIERKWKFSFTIQKRISKQNKPAFMITVCGALLLLLLLAGKGLRMRVVVSEGRRRDRWNRVEILTKGGNGQVREKERECEQLKNVCYVIVILFFFSFGSDVIVILGWCFGDFNYKMTTPSP